MAFGSRTNPKCLRVGGTSTGLIQAVTDACSPLDVVHTTLRDSLSGTFLQTARFSYATEEALVISAQLSTDAVSALRKV